MTTRRRAFSIIWVKFLNHKDEAFKVFCEFIKQVQNIKGVSSIVIIRNDYGEEFDNEKFLVLCKNYDINHDFSTLRAPQHYGIIERNNISLQEMVRTMLMQTQPLSTFW